jgi:putative DNA primase/helicase
MPLVAKSEPASTGPTVQPEAATTIAGWLDDLFGGQVGRWFELRAVGVRRHSSATPHTESRIYACHRDGFKAAARDARDLTTRARGVYVCMAPLTTDLGRATTDADVDRRTLMLIDIDPVRPSGLSSTDGEKMRAWEVLKQIRDLLRSQGWPEPATADSGNGYHLLCRIDLPNDEASQDLVRSALRALGDRYGSESVEIDQTVYNASRITKFYGTLASKGESTPERPHRTSGIMSMPKPWQVVLPGMLETLAELAPARPETNGKPHPESNGNGSGKAHKPAARKGRLIARDLGPDPREAYGLEALAREVAAVSSARSGTRNKELFRAAAALHEIAEAGALDQDHVDHELTIAAGLAGLDVDPNCGPEGIAQTLASARKRTAGKPRDMSHVGKDRSPAPHPAATVEREDGLLESYDDPHRLARLYLAQQHRHTDGSTLVYWNEEWHAWNGDCWRPHSDREINARLTIVSKQEFDLHAQSIGKLPKGVGTRLIGNIAQALRGMTLVSVGQVEQMPAWLGTPGPNPAECLATRSGILHLPTLLEHGPGHPGAVIPVSPRYFASHSLTYAFDPNAPKPTSWFDFLESVWPGDDESKLCLQQWAGYLLTVQTFLQKILLMVGPRRSGKGTIARTLRLLVGEQNVASPTLSSLGGPFGLQPLIGRSVAIVPEARISGRADSQVIVERLLSVSGEDPQTIDRKHLTAWHGLLRTRFVLLGNELPRLGDVSSALPGRLSVLKMVHSWQGREDRGLQDRIIAELPGILLWAIGGWHSLQQMGRFVEPASAASDVDEMEALSNPVGAFLAECCDISPRYETRIKDLYDRWVTWCKDNGKDHTGDLQGFSRNIRTVMPGIGITRPRVNGERSRYFQGLRVRPEEF